MKKAFRVCSRASLAVLVLVGGAFGLFFLVDRLFPSLDFDPMASRVAVVVIPEVIIVMVLVTLWRKRRPVGIGIMLTVRDCSRALEFYKAAFGAVVTYRLDRPGGCAVARLAILDSEFWFSDEGSEFSNSSPESLGGVSTRLILSVSDPDEYFRRAIGVGASEVHPVTDKHGVRVGRVRDPFGHQWEISRRLST
jgi:PhnB protein